MFTKIIDAITGRAIKRENEILNACNITQAFQNTQHLMTIDKLMERIDDLEAKLTSSTARDPKTGRMMKLAKP